MRHQVYKHEQNKKIYLEIEVAFNEISNGNTTHSHIVTFDYVIDFFGGCQFHVSVV